MQTNRLMIALMAGAAGLSLGLASQGVMAADDVTINLDALEPAAKPKKPVKPKTEPATDSNIDPSVMEPVPDPAPMSLNPGKAKPPKPASPATVEAATPAPAVAPIIKTATTPKPKLAVKPDAADPATVAAAPASPPKEIDFITRSKIVPDDEPVSVAKPAAVPVAPAPTTLPEVTVAPPIAPVAVQAPKAPPAIPKKNAQTPANVVVNSGALDSAITSPPAAIQGTPLTASKPNGALFVPQSIETLPQPVSGPQTNPAVEEEEEIPSPLTAPPALPAPPLPPPVPETSVDIETPSTQSIAAVAPQSRPDAGASVASRSAALAGHATAAEVKFAPGKEELTPEGLATLDGLVEDLKLAAVRIQLAGYSGRAGNNSSDARRLSLRRALAVRTYLTTRGIPKSLANVVAFGGALQGDTDRVDVMVRTEQLSKLIKPGVGAPITP